IIDYVIQQFKEIPTTAISDVLKVMNNIDPLVKPLKDEYKIAGQAFTVKTAVGDNLALLKALKEAKPGDILVVDVKGDTYRAVAGDFVVGMMQTLELDRKSTRLNSSHVAISYAVFCLKKKKKHEKTSQQ